MRFDTLKQNDLIYVTISFILLTSYFSISFGFTPYSYPWRRNRQEFYHPKLEDDYSTEKLSPSTISYHRIQTADADIERLRDKVTDLENKLIKCALYLKNNRNYNIPRVENGIPPGLRRQHESTGVYGSMPYRFQSALPHQSASNHYIQLPYNWRNPPSINSRNPALSKYSKPPRYHRNILQYVPPLSVPSPQGKFSQYRKPRPSWMLARPGVAPKPYHVVEPVPGVPSYTTPPTIFNRKIVKTHKYKATTENNMIEVDITTTSPTKASTKRYDILPFYAHEAIESPKNQTQNSESFNLKPFFIHELFNTNITEVNETSPVTETMIQKITPSYIWHPLPMFETNQSNAKSKTNNSLEYMLQPRNLIDHGRTIKLGAILKGHYVTRRPEKHLKSVTTSQNEYQILPTASSTVRHQTEETAVKESDIITVPFPFVDVTVTEATNTNDSTPLLITKENMKNFNLNKSLVYFNIADDKNSNLESRKYRITKSSYDMPYYTNTTGMRQSRLENISTLVSSSMLVEER